jgi:hypothetical protein
MANINNEPSIQTCAHLYSGRSAPSKATPGIMSLQGQYFTFTDKDGEALVKLSTNEIKRFAAGTYRGTMWQIIPGDKQSHVLKFAPYKASKEETNNDNTRYDRWLERLIGPG